MKKLILLVCLLGVALARDNQQAFEHNAKVMTAQQIKIANQRGQALQMKGFFGSRRADNVTEEELHRDPLLTAEDPGPSPDAPGCAGVEYPHGHMHACEAVADAVVTQAWFQCDTFTKMMGISLQHCGLIIEVDTGNEGRNELRLLGLEQYEGCNDGEGKANNAVVQCYDKGPSCTFDFDGNPAGADKDRPYVWQFDQLPSRKQVDKAAEKAWKLMQCTDGPHDPNLDFITYEHALVEGFTVADAMVWSKEFLEHDDKYSARKNNCQHYTSYVYSRLTGDKTHGPQNKIMRFFDGRTTTKFNHQELKELSKQNRKEQEEHVREEERDDEAGKDHFLS